MHKIILTFLFLINITSLHAYKIEVVTEKYPPFQWYENEKITGPTTDIVEAMIKKTGTLYTLDIYPWARAYKIALNNENVLIYSITRSKKRENLFKWIGVIASHDTYLWKLKSRKDIVINSLDDAKKYITAGVRKDAKTQYLLDKGFSSKKQVATVHSTDIAIKLLHSNKVELIVENEDLSVQVKRLGLDINKFEKVYYLKNFGKDLYAAFSLNTPDEVVEKHKKALQELKATGEFKRITNKYK